MRTLAQSARDLATGTSSRSLVEECLARILDPAGEGRRTFLKVHADQARAAADYIDTLRRHGAAPSRFAGIPISVKDLFDIAGDVTTAGSVALRDTPAAMRDATAVARIRANGLIPIGRTNMTEFAFSGVGLNPHYDTPRNPYAPPAGCRAAPIGRRRVGHGRHGGRGTRHRHRRFMPHSGGGLRDRGLQADRQADSDRRRAAAVVHPRFGGTTGANGCLLRGARCRDGRRRAERSPAMAA
jgi:hypothetical protein